MARNSLDGDAVRISPCFCGLYLKISQQLCKNITMKDQTKGPPGP